MTPDAWLRVKTIVHDALERRAHERAAFVAEACGEDGDLRAEVESLLLAHERAGASFLQPISPVDVAPMVNALHSTARTLRRGDRLGPYEIVDALGAGGMGEVYRARDLRLDRTVAIKVLPTQVARDPQARERLEREARAVAALNHPHICTLHDIGRLDPSTGSGHAVDYLVMEFIEGETLAARLERGPLSIEQALQVGEQVTSALDRAHRAGIVHRDLKPGNVMLTKSGAKLLDFGLAKIRPAIVAPGTAPLSALSELTTPGTILGTVHYMAPEQLEGTDIDTRADIFAFGAVLFEMLTGSKAFQGDSAASVIGAILKTDPPPVSEREPLAPPALDRIVRTCLAKDPDNRWQSARDLGRELGWVADSAATMRDASFAWRRPPVLVASAVAAVAVAAVGMATASLWRADAAVNTPDVRFSIYPERGSAFAMTLASVPSPQFALSPDGNHLAFVATHNGRPVLWVRTLNALSARAIPGTDDAALPFWSADSREVAFFAQGNKLRSVPLSGGVARVRADASIDSRGGAWAPDGTILASLASNGGLSLVSPDGTVRPAMSLDRAGGENTHRWPSVHPDGRHFFFSIRNPDIRKRGIYISAIGDTTRTRLVEGDWGAASANGHLLFLRGGTLMAQPLDVANRRLTGEPVPLVDNVGVTTTGYAAFGVSHSGTLAYANPWPTRGELTWFARDGRRVGAPIAPPGDYVDFTLAPDAGRVAISQVDPQTNTPDIWLLDIARGSMTRLTSDPMTDASPCWSPDGSRVIFRSNRRGVMGLFSKPANGNRAEEFLFEQTEERTFANVATLDCSRDGAHLVFTDIRSSFDLSNLALTTPPVATAILQTPFNEYHGTLSPDGRWLAYASDETGAPEVYVQSFPGGEQRYQVSSQGGTEPHWRRDGKELYFLDGELSLMAVSVSAQRTFTAGLPVRLFLTHVPLTANPYRRHYIPAPDGERFLINTTVDNLPTPAIHVVLDWRALLDETRKAR